jgi:hypothetical protein
MRLELRQEPNLPADGVLIIHMGTGDPARFVNTVLASHDAWLRFTDRGRFAFSVFAASTEGERDNIIGSFPHGKYGTATVAEVVAAGFELVATNTIDINDDVLAAIQPFHYSIVVGEGFERTLLGANEATIEALSVELLKKLTDAFALFVPRKTNPLKRKS